MTTPQQPVADFGAWRHETLVRFAENAQREMRRQAELIEQLQQERRDAIDAYRALMRRQDDARSQDQDRG